MFLYQFIRCRCQFHRHRWCRCRPQTFVEMISFKQLFISFSFLAGLMALTWPINYLIKFWSILALTLTLNSQGWILNLLYLREIYDCHEMKNKHIDWVPGFKCGHQFWPWPWPWPSLGYVWEPDITDRVTSDVGMPSTDLLLYKMFDVHDLVACCKWAMFPI